MAVVSSGLTPYLQAGDVGIFKSFNDKISVFINEWKRQSSVVQQSVGKCGFFANPSDWYISKHDVYGSQFNAAWNARSDASSDSDIEDDTNSTFDDVLDTLDEIVVQLVTTEYICWH
ncbi:hypothetical protein L915_17972 [Phytophthora nicotianae]|uniref:Uncharacterized protein n=1 Tax=Phytophthora nicotianae TaxID=4792 RepID=W2FZM1_PHYNI|nr:hypothetical protein L915_17972 [Phytophthora nicotianae]ETL28834.1 hypothetical protein L916_17868 [Phytophthora nicotianae]